ARIPSLYVRKAVYTFAVPINVLIEDIVDLEEQMDGGQPSILIVDDDTKFIEELRLQLDSVFRIYVSHNDIGEAGALILYSDMVLLGTMNRYTLPEFLGLYHMFALRKQSQRFHLYYLAQDDEERIRLSAGDFNMSASIILSKETEPYRIANYLKEKLNPSNIGVL
ncbi:MAG: hypothetical protein IK096_07160, partial [Lachnospiraceae bacterium]|nr:hypothetical protein [Lachnospiraceae bacterium]